MCAMIAEYEMRHHKDGNGKTNKNKKKSVVEYWSIRSSEFFRLTVCSSTAAHFHWNCVFPSRSFAIVWKARKLKSVLLLFENNIISQSPFSDPSFRISHKMQFFLSLPFLLTFFDFIAWPTWLWQLMIHKVVQNFRVMRMLPEIRWIFKFEKKTGSAVERYL